MSREIYITNDKIIVNYDINTCNNCCRLNYLISFPYKRKRTAPPKSHLSLSSSNNRHGQRERESNRKNRRKRGEKVALQLVLYRQLMGGGTFVDGVRRWFQRRPTSVTSTNLASSNNSSVINDPNLNALLRENQQQQGLTVIEHNFDISGLDLIKVPKRVSFPLSSSSMDSHKKVLFRFGICIVQI